MVALCQGLGLNGAVARQPLPSPMVPSDTTPYRHSTSSSSQAILLLALEGGVVSYLGSGVAVLTSRFGPDADKHSSSPAGR